MIETMQRLLRLSWRHATVHPVLGSSRLGQFRKGEQTPSGSVTREAAANRDYFVRVPCLFPFRGLLALSRRIGSPFHGFQVLSPGGYTFALVDNPRKTPRVVCRARASATGKNNERGERRPSEKTTGFSDLTQGRVQTPTPMVNRLEVLARIA